MKSLKELYRIGPGPSSSHTLGPQRAASLFKERYPNAHHFEVELFGSLALTGKGHLTDYIIIETMKPKECVVFFKNRKELKHPNTMQLSAFDEADCLLGEWTVYSVGGGAIQIEGEASKEGADVYPHHLMKDIEAYCEAHSMTLWEYVNHFDPLDDYMDTILQQMMATVDGGLAREGVLPGDLKLKRIAKEMRRKVPPSRKSCCCVPMPIVQVRKMLPEVRRSQLQRWEAAVFCRRWYAIITAYWAYPESSFAMA